MMHSNTSTEKADKKASSTSASGNASSAGPAKLGASIDLSTLSPGITSAQGFSSSSSVSASNTNPTEQEEDIGVSSFHAPEDGLMQEPQQEPQRDSRAPEDFNSNEPKSFGSGKGQKNEPRSQAGQAGDSGRSETIERNTGNSGRSQAFEKSARNSEGDSTPRAGDSQTNSARSTRSSQGSSKEGPVGDISS